MFRFQFLWAFLMLPFIILFFLALKNRGNIKFSNVEIVKRSGKVKTIKHKIGKWVIFLGIISLVTALARPQIVDVKENSQKMGIDIVVALDVSGSMKSVDIKPDRLEVAKEMTIEFIEKRVNDRIGFVIFSGTAFTKTPLTTDYNIIKNMIQQIEAGDVTKDGTAIGMGLAVSANRLKTSNAKSKVIVLLTDGDNNAGTVTPETAAEVTRQLGIKVYTIGIGTNETIIPRETIFGVRYERVEGGLNEPLLQNIASLTGGEYFRAQSGESLKSIFDTIDRLEKTKIDINNIYNYTELYHFWVILGLILILLGLVLEELIFIRVP